MSFDWQAESAVPSGPLVAATQISPHVHTVAPPPPTKSFAQVLATSQSSVKEISPLPVIRGDEVSIKITPALYEKGLTVCKRNLRGRLVLNKGDKSYSTKEVQQKLVNHWKTTSPWTMLFLGRGYYEFFFSSELDLRTVWASGTVNLKPGVLRLFEWAKDFQGSKQRNTHAQVWIRLMELPQEYWMEGTIREIASAVGTPLILDNATSKRLFGHYARVLVDMDFSRKIFHEIVVEREGYSFKVEVHYEWLPEFCSHCQNIGHNVSSCRWLYPPKESTVNTEAVNKGKKHILTRRTDWVPAKDNPSGIGSSKAFAHPAAVPTEQQPLTVPQPVAHQLTKPQQTPPVTVQHDTSFTAEKDHESEHVTLIENITDDQHDNVYVEEENADAQLNVDTEVNFQVDDNLEQINDTPIQVAAVEDTLALTETHNGNQQSNSFADMRITGPWCDAVTDMDYGNDHNLDNFEQELGTNNSVFRTDLNLSNYSANVIHDMQVLGLVPTMEQQTMDFLSDSWTNMGHKENQPFQLVVPKKKKGKKRQSEASKGFKVGSSTRSQSHY